MRSRGVWLAVVPALLAGCAQATTPVPVRPAALAAAGGAATFSATFSAAAPSREAAGWDRSSSAVGAGGGVWRIGLPGPPGFATTSRTPAVRAAEVRTAGVPAAGGWRGRLDREVGRFLARRPGRASVAVYDRSTGERYAFREGGQARADREPFMLASVAKVDILLALLLSVQREHRELTGSERSLAASMIRHSDNASAATLYRRIGGRSGLTRVLRGLGVDDTWPGTGPFWGSTRSFPADQVEVLDRLTDHTGPVHARHRRFAGRLMATVVPDQAWGVGRLAKGAEVKNGWLPAQVHGGLWTVNTLGRVTMRGHELLIAVLSDHHPSMGSGVTTVGQVARLVAEAFAYESSA
ncbi:hypothetical protein [Nonomuraea sp. NPDC050310]|uniref:hypothetical protein n=1 Tax=Nonomuraea sp. NPDC050310 TaxID=3154935 RepID=UPI00340CEB9E